MGINYKDILVRKGSGDLVPFNEDKLIHSLERSGAESKIIDEVVNEIRNMLHQKITTKEIYRAAFRLLKQQSNHSAARYQLKKGIYELGPSGFPFEKFIAAILQEEGYHVKNGVIVKGKCVNHEIDVIAQKDNEHFMIECKFHSDPSRFCNVKIPLYIQSRFLDVQDSWVKIKGHESKFHQGWVVTNTRFTTDALDFGNCAGLYLVSWDTPDRDSLKNRIDRLGLHPLTCITTLNKAEKQALLNEGIVLTKHLCHNPNLLDKIGINSNRKEKILKESELICRLITDY